MGLMTLVGLCLVLGLVSGYLTGFFGAGWTSLVALSLLLGFRRFGVDSPDPDTLFNSLTMAAAACSTAVAGALVTRLTVVLLRPHRRAVDRRLVGWMLPGMALGVGLFGGLAIGLSALFQGKCAAAAADALGATGKGTANYFIVIGIVETVALFTLVFSLLLLNG